jgi:hypothetical protein
LIDGGNRGVHHRLGQTYQPLTAVLGLFGGTGDKLTDSFANRATLMDDRFRLCTNFVGWIWTF